MSTLKMQLQMLSHLLCGIAFEFFHNNVQYKGLKNKFIFSYFWRLGAQDQGICRVDLLLKQLPRVSSSFPPCPSIFLKFLWYLGTLEKLVTLCGSEISVPHKIT